MSNTFGGYSTNANLTGMASEYQVGGGSIFNTIGSLFLFVTFGIGLPEGTPLWFQFIYSAWSIIMILLTAAFIYQAVRSGS